MSLKYRYPCAKPASPAASRGPLLGARGGGADVPAHPTPAVASGVACSVPMWGVHSLNARLAKASPAPQPWVSAAPPSLRAQLLPLSLRASSLCALEAPWRAAWCLGLPWWVRSGGHSAVKPWRGRVQGVTSDSTCRLWSRVS